MPRKQFLISALDSCGERIDGPRVNVGRTLARIPDDVVLSVCTRDIELDFPATCLCGWAVREELLRTTGEMMDDWADPESDAVELFGGSQREWTSVFMGVIRDALPVIEQAWTERVDKAVRRA